MPIGNPTSCHICSLRSQRCTWPSSQLVNEGSTLIGSRDSTFAAHLGPVQTFVKSPLLIPFLAERTLQLHSGTRLDDVDCGTCVAKRRQLGPGCEQFPNLVELVEWFCSAYPHPYQPHINPIFQFG